MVENFKNPKPDFPNIKISKLWNINPCLAEEKRDRRDSTGDEREGQGKKRNRNESEETEENKNIPPLPLRATRIAGLAQL